MKVCNDVLSENKRYLFEKSLYEDNLIEAIKNKFEDYIKNFSGRWSKKMIVQDVINMTSDEKYRYCGNAFKNLLISKLNVPIYFPLGKYKGHIVQNILVEDKNYCEWFVRNIIPTNYTLLLINNYIYSNGKIPTAGSINLNKIRDEVVELTVPKDYLETFKSLPQININELYNNDYWYFNSDKNCGYDYDIGGYEDEDFEYPDYH